MTGVVRRSHLFCTSTWWVEMKEMTKNIKTPLAQKALKLHMVGSREALLRKYHKYTMLRTHLVTVIPRHLLLGATKPGYSMRCTFDVTYPGLHHSKAEGSSWDSINKPEGLQRRDSLSPQMPRQSFFSLAELQGRAHVVAWGRESGLQWANWGLSLGQTKTLHKEEASHCIGASTPCLMCTGAWFSVLQAALACLQYPWVSARLWAEGELPGEAGVLVHCLPQSSCWPAWGLRKRMPARRAASRMSLPLTSNVMSNSSHYSNARDIPLAEMDILHLNRTDVYGLCGERAARLQPVAYQLLLWNGLMLL